MSVSLTVCRNFIATISRRLRSRALDAEIPIDQQQPRRPTLDEVRAAVAREWNLPGEALERRRAGAPRIAAIYLATKACGLPAREVGAAFRVKRGRVSNVVAQVERRRDPSFLNRLAAMERVLRSTDST